MMEKAGMATDAWIADNLDKNSIAPGSRYSGPQLPGGSGSLWSERDLENGPRLPQAPGHGSLYGDFSDMVLPPLVDEQRAEIDKLYKELEIQSQLGEESVERAYESAATKYNNAVTDIQTGNDNAAAALEKFKRDQEEAAKNNEGKDRLAEFGVERPKGEDSSGGAAAKKKADAELKEFERLKKKLGDEETLIEESYARRVELIDKYTQDGSKQEMELSLAAVEEWEEAQLKRAEAMMKFPEKMAEAFDLEEAILKESYERRKQIVLESTETTEKEKQALLEKLNQDYKQNTFKILDQQISTQLDAWGGLFQNLETLGGAYGKKGFEIQKAAAMASAVISGIEATIHAYKEGTKISVYAGPAFAAAAAAATGAQIGALAATEYTGTHATGGLIPPGRWGVVGEAGAEVVRGPAMITSAQASADHYGHGGGSGGGNVTVNITNGQGIAAEARETQTPDGRSIEIITRLVESNLDKRMDEGSSPLGRTLEKRYNLRRGR
jgi:hypothetical protein